MNTNDTIVIKTRAVVITAIITVFLMLQSILGMAAGTDALSKASRENLKMEISRQVPCPDFVTENSEANDVKAVISVGENGALNIEAINTTNPQLKNYVTRQLNNIQLSDAASTEPFVLVIKFRVL